jgi:hypothetical protein
MHGYDSPQNSLTDHPPLDSEKQSPRPKRSDSGKPASTDGRFFDKHRDRLRRRASYFVQHQRRMDVNVHVMFCGPSLLLQRRLPLARHVIPSSPVTNFEARVGGSGGVDRGRREDAILQCYHDKTGCFLLWLAFHESTL